jgi:aminoglycoside 6'-N-acetyltransferase
VRQLPGRPIAEGAPIVAVDPDAENVRARRDYAKAGFRLTGIVETSEGQVALMIFD